MNNNEKFLATLISFLLSSGGIEAYTGGFDVGLCMNSTPCEIRKELPYGENVSLLSFGNGMRILMNSDTGEWTWVDDLYGNHAVPDDLTGAFAEREEIFKTNIPSDLTGSSGERRVNPKK